MRKASGNFKDERLKYFGQKILYQEKPESLSKDLYTKIHKDTAKRLLSKNNEKWNTIPRTYSEIDTLRIKYEKEGKKREPSRDRPQRVKMKPNGTRIETN